MKTRSVRRILVIASLMAAFVLYLCDSVADITPLIVMTALIPVFALIASQAGITARSYVSVKLYTQKAE